MRVILRGSYHTGTNCYKYRICPVLDSTTARVLYYRDGRCPGFFQRPWERFRGRVVLLDHPAPHLVNQQRSEAQQAR